MAVPKIMGLEQEYGLIPSDDNILSDILVNTYINSVDARCRYANYLSKYVENIDELDISGAKDAGYFLPNGARYYVDHFHPEYSTPECSSPLELVTCDKAGEAILNKSVEIALNANIMGLDTKKIKIYKNNVDKTGNSYASHENYLLDSKTFDELFNSKKLLNFLAAFLATRQILCGSGKIDPDDGLYAISQRASFMEKLCSIGTTRNRAIINTRDEPHADPLKYRRLHLILGDANMSEYSMYLKTGLTGIILQMIEDGFTNKLGLAKPIKAIKSISKDIRLKEQVRMLDGRWLTPIQIQKEFLELAKKYYDSNKSSKTELTDDLLEKWGYCLDGLEKLVFDGNEVLEDDPHDLRKKVDWVIKKLLLDLQYTKNGWPYGDARMQKLDLDYHNINKAEGLYYLLEKSRLVERIVSDEEIDNYVQNPPRNTRAYFRGKFIRKFHGNIKSADWAVINIETKEKYLKLRLLHPDRGTESLTKDLLDNSASIDEFV